MNSKENKDFEPPDITYILMALDGFERGGPEVTMIMPHLPLGPFDECSASLVSESGCKALQREVPKLIAELGIVKLELERAKLDLLDLAYTLDIDGARLRAGRMLRALSATSDYRRRAVSRLIDSGKMLVQKD